MKQLKHVDALLRKFEDGLAGFVLCAVLLTVTYEMVVRGIFGASNLWTDELSRVLLIALTYISAVGLTRDSANVRVELFVDKLGPAARELLDRVVDVFCFLFAILATWIGIDYVKETALFGISFAHSNLPFPVWAAQLVIPVGFGLMSFRLALRILGVRPSGPVASVEA